LGIEAWDDRKIAQMIANYRRNGVSEGGVVPLSDLLVERLRRTKSDIDTVALAKAIVANAAVSTDGLTTYKELWTEFRPGEEWVGNKSQQIMGNALSRVVSYCVRHRLPILTVLVVQSGTRALDPKAITNIANDSRELGLDVGPDPSAFVDRQRDLAREVVVEAMPEESFGG
jgi:hypothetical protein